MQKVIINQTEAIQLLKGKADLSDYEIQLDAAPVEALDAILLGRNGISIPESLIYYEDEAIDFSDDPDLTDEDLSNGKIKWLVYTELALDEEIRDWVKKENINLSELLSNMVTNFYQNVQSLRKNSASWLKMLLNGRRVVK